MILPLEEVAISSTRVARLSLRRAMARTEAPAEAKARAMERPMPAEQPVTTACGVLAD